MPNRVHAARPESGGVHVAKLLSAGALLAVALARGNRQSAEPHDTPKPDAVSDADRPTEIPSHGWWEVLKRVWDEVGRDNMSIIAAGCGFYALLALFPAITALVAIYGIVADPGTIEQQVGALSGTFLSTELTGETLVDGTRLTLVFDDGNLAAVAGCNNLIGGYEIDGGVLQVEQLAQTLMACEDDLQRQDEWISNLLTSGPTVSLDGDVLTISGQDVTVVFGEREVAEASDPLESTAWEMVSLDGPDGSTGAPEGASLVFATGTGGWFLAAITCGRAITEHWKD